jgi:hypothetical protein
MMKVVVLVAQIYTDCVSPAGTKITIVPRGVACPYETINDARGAGELEPPAVTKAKTCRRWGGDFNKCMKS